MCWAKQVKEIVQGDWVRNTILDDSMGNGFAAIKNLIKHSRLQRKTEFIE